VGAKFQLKSIPTGDAIFNIDTLKISKIILT